VSHQLVSVSAPRDAHREGCTFGPGFYRLEYESGGRHFYQSEAELHYGLRLLVGASIRRVVRDGYCLDAPEGGTPDVIEGETFLAMSREDGMRELGIETEADYARAYRAVEDAVLARDRAQHAGNPPSIVIKKKGRKVNDVDGFPGAA